MKIAIAIRVGVLVAALVLTACSAPSQRRAAGFSETTMDLRAATEIEQLHQFFQDWFRGELDKTDEAFARFENALSPGFIIISPDGAAHDRESILDAVRSGHGSDPSAEIWIRNVRLRATGRDHVLATYEEWQRLRGDERGRLSTVLFDRDDEAANGLRWRHVHETWLSED